MIIKIKNKEFDQYGYKLNSVEFKDAAFQNGPKCTDIFLYFDKEDNTEHMVHFVTDKIGLISKFVFAKHLKNENMYVCLKESVKYLNEKGTYMNSGYVSVVDSIPTEIIDSEKFEHLITYFPTKYRNMVKSLKLKHNKDNAVNN